MFQLLGHASPVGYSRAREREREGVGAVSGVGIITHLVDVFLVSTHIEIFSEWLSITETLECRVHETCVSCREITERLLRVY